MCRVGDLDREAVLIRKLVLVVLVAVLSAALFPPAHAASIAVTARDNAFEPANIKAKIGQEVVWTNADSAQEAHNVREDRKIFYSGTAFDVQLSYSRVFSAGTFHYFCERHGFRGGGMDGTVKVPVKLAAAPSGPNFTVAWATGASNTGSKYTIRYRIGSGVWKTWRSGTSARTATFKGAVAGKRYTFRAKSLKGDASSKWSPPISITS